MIHPPRWSTKQLEFDSLKSAGLFRDERLEGSAQWEGHFQTALDEFEQLFATLEDLSPDGDVLGRWAEAFRKKLGRALGYLAGPPISNDDLKIVADVDSLAPGVISKNKDALIRVFRVIDEVLDTHRFPWVRENRTPGPHERRAAILSSAVLMATQRIATERRNSGKNTQEGGLKDYLRSIGFTEVPPTAISTIVHGPQDMEFCAEAKLDERKADVILRLHDTRLMAFECKVSNSSTNSIKRLTGDVAAKAEHWAEQFGTKQVVPAALLAGVFKVLTLEQAQARNLSIFWSHDLDSVGKFIESTRYGMR